MTKDIMIDLETFGTGNDAAIVSIGAVAFNADDQNNAALFTNSPELLRNIGQAFYVKVDLGSSRHPGIIDPDTVEWWMGQSDEARAALLGGRRMSLGDALRSFARWVEGEMLRAGRPVRLWSRGPTFDETIIRSAFRRYDMDLPISFRNSRCCRTLEDTARELGWESTEGTRVGLTTHNALDDAVGQARTVVDQRGFLRRLKASSYPTGGDCSTCDLRDE